MGVVQLQHSSFHPQLKIRKPVGSLTADSSSRLFDDSPKADRPVKRTSGWPLVADVATPNSDILALAFAFSLSFFLI
jgi:hypothetical protein